MMNLIGQEVGNYQLLDFLGQGSSADVYLAEHKHSRSYVAIKTYRTQATRKREQRWHNEVSLLSRLTHPHIICMHDYGTQDKMQFLVMDWATQGTLIDLFAQELPISAVTTYIKQIAYALQYLHTMHIIHRDIKPTNILVKQSDKVLLADFESAIDHRNCQSRLATAAYAASEQTQGQPCPASDQYALGVITYQWLCGELPFHGSFAEMVAQHRYASPPPLRDKVPLLPSAIEQVVSTALAKDPRSRFTNVQTFAEALEQASCSSTYWTSSQIGEVLGSDSGSQTGRSDHLESIS